MEITVICRREYGVVMVMFATELQTITARCVIIYLPLIENLDTRKMYVNGTRLMWSKISDHEYVIDWIFFSLSFFFSLFRISRVIVRFSFSFLLSPTHTLRFLSKLKNNTHTMFHSLLKCVQCLSCRWFFPLRSVW